MRWRIKAYFRKMSARQHGRKEKKLISSFADILREAAVFMESNLGAGWRGGARTRAGLRQCGRSRTSSPVSRHWRKWRDQGQHLALHVAGRERPRQTAIRPLHEAEPWPANMHGLEAWPPLSCQSRPALQLWPFAWPSLVFLLVYGDCIGNVDSLSAVKEKLQAKKIASCHPLRSENLPSLVKLATC